jgi:L-ascorbate metabolism protein UlaG (beta-lactamase superfamily)
MRRFAAFACAAMIGCGGTSSSPDSAPAPVVEIEYVAHAAFRIHTAAGTTVLLDPFASAVWLGYDFPDALLDADIVAVTHPHYDHDYGEFINRPTPWTGEQTVLRDAGTFTIGDVALTGVDTKHHDPYGQEFGQKNVVWVVEIDGVRIAHLGDTAPLEAGAVAAIGRVDVLLAPIDSTEHILSYAELDAIRSQLSPRTVVPMHYRIPELETDPNSPQDLGPVDPWLDTQTDVLRLDGNRYEVSTDTLDALPAVVAFEHSPMVTAASP